MKDKLLRLASNNMNLQACRVKPESQLNTDLYQWFCANRSNGLPISDALLQEVALDMSRSKGNTIFKASNGWLESFKRRYGITSKVISGESASVDHNAASSWISGLSHICSEYLPRDILNMDETGYFFRAMPQRSLVSGKDACKGGKFAKDRLTAVITCSMEGEKLPLLIIGKAANPRSFKTGDHERHGCEYKNSNKAWMTTKIFNEHLCQLNEKMKAQRRKILLFIDNAPVHVIDESTKALLTHVKVQHFPANMTSVVQLLDAGIIRSLKCKARRYSILKIKALLDVSPNYNASFFANKLTLLDAVAAASHAWREVTKETIENCFRKCGFGSTIPSGLEITENTDGFDAIVEQLGFQDFDLIDSPSFVFPENGTIPWQDLVHEEPSQTLVESDEDDDLHDISTSHPPHKYSPPSFAEVQKSLSTLALYFEKQGMAQESMNMYTALSNLGTGDSSRFKQTLITDFLNKE